MKKILIPIKVNEELPEGDIAEVLVDFNDERKIQSIYHFDEDNGWWMRNVDIWYKEVTIDELYLPGEVEQKIFAHFKDNHDVLLMDDDFNCLQNIIINYIKQKLER